MNAVNLKAVQYRNLNKRVIDELRTVLAELESGEAVEFIGTVMYPSSAKMIGGATLDVDRMIGVLTRMAMNLVAPDLPKEQ